MSDPYISQISVFGFGWPPVKYALCNGALLPISQNQALFSLLGDTFGGDGRTTYGLPNLEGRTPMHPGPTVFNSPGIAAGVESVVLSHTELAHHTHAFKGTTTEADQLNPGGMVLADTNPLLGADGPLYGAGTNLQSLAPSAIGATGGSGPHNNIQPSLAVNFCIATQGIYPSRN